MATNPTRVLVVDDGDDNRELYVHYLSSVGYEVDEAHDGQVALEKIAAHRFDVVVMDLAMPHLDGIEATRRIKSGSETRDIVVIVVTGNATRSDMQAARDAGADDVCTKPCMPQDLRAKIERALGR